MTDAATLLMPCYSNNVDRVPRLNDPALKRQWVDALRSGDYTQGKGYLHQNDTYCCLGVLCDLRDDVMWEDLERVSGVNYAVPVDNKDWTSSAMLPHTLADKLGLTDGEVTIPLVPFMGEMLLTDWVVACETGITLAALNDEGLTFDQIADLIEYFL